jgi:cytochrome P450
LPLPKQTKTEAREFYNFNKQRFELRVKQGADRNDIFSYLLNPDIDTGVSLTPKELEADSGVVIIAGA